LFFDGFENIYFRLCGPTTTFLALYLFFDPGLRPLFLGSEAAAGGVATALVTAFGLRAILFFIV